MRAAEQALANRHAQNLNRIHSMDALSSLANLPELQDRRHSMPAGADGDLRRSRPPPLRTPMQQDSRADDNAAAGAVLCNRQRADLVLIALALGGRERARSPTRPAPRSARLCASARHCLAANEDLGRYRTCHRSHMVL